MRELVVGAGCVLGLLAVLWLLTGVFDSSAGKPSHAMELAHARAEAEQARAELEKAKSELKAAADALEAERKKVAELEKRLAEGPKVGGAAPVPAAGITAAAGR